MRREGKYYLVREYTSTGDKEYYDLSERYFTEDQPEPVALSKIDATTTLFDSARDFFTLVDGEPMQRDSGVGLYIESVPTKENELPKRLTPVFNDQTLNALAKVTEDGVNFTGNEQYSFLLAAIREIIDRNNGFARSVIEATSEDTKLNDECRTLVSKQSYNPNSDMFPQFMEQFGSYKQCRALYLGYKRHKIREEEKKKREGVQPGI